jgi:hypothetical protein
MQAALPLCMAPHGHNDDAQGSTCTLANALTPHERATRVGFRIDDMLADSCGQRYKDNDATHPRQIGSSRRIKTWLWFHLMLDHGVLSVRM